MCRSRLVRLSVSSRFLKAVVAEANALEQLADVEGLCTKQVAEVDDLAKQTLCITAFLDFKDRAEFYQELMSNTAIADLVNRFTCDKQNTEKAQQICHLYAAPNEVISPPRDLCW